MLIAVKTGLSWILTWLVHGFFVLRKPSTQPFAKTVLVPVKQSTCLSFLFTYLSVSSSTSSFPLGHLCLRGRKCSALTLSCVHTISLLLFLSNILFIHRNDFISPRVKVFIKSARKNPFAFFLSHDFMRPEWPHCLCREKVKNKVVLNPLHFQKYFSTTLKIL